MRSRFALALTVVGISALAVAAFASADYNSAVLADSPLVYYHLDEGSGSVAADSSGSSPAVDGTYNGDVQPVASAFSSGGGAVKLGTTGTVTATLPATAQTAEFWVNPSARTPQTFIQHGDPDSDGWAIGIAPTSATRGGKRKLHFQSNGVSVNSRITLASGTWTLVDVTWDSAHVKFVINGGAISKSLNTPGGWTPPGPASNTALQLGPGLGGGTSFDEVALFATPLSAGQIKAHYDATLLPQTLSPPVLSPLSGVRDGDTLTLTQGTYSGAITPTEQWQRCDQNAVCSDITGATGTSYTLTPDDVGDIIQVQESATNANGSTTVITDATDPVVAHTPFVIDQPSVSGTPSGGQALAADPGHWGGTPTITFAFQWQRCNAAGANCVNIAGASSASYLIDGTADAGATLLVAVSAANAGGTTTATSPATTAVPIPPPTSPSPTPTPTGSTPTGSTPTGSTPTEATPTAGTPTETTPTGGTPTGTTPTGGTPVAPTLLCTPSITPVRARTSRLGTTKLTLRLSTTTNRAILRAKRGTVRSVTFRLDARRLRISRRTPYAVTLRPSGLKAGRHLLKVLVKPRHGKSRIIALRLTVRGC